MNSVAFSKVPNPKTAKSPDAAVKLRKKDVQDRATDRISGNTAQEILSFYNKLYKRTLMIMTITFAFAVVTDLAGNTFASASQDGPNDGSEAFGGTPAGGEC